MDIISHFYGDTGTLYTENKNIFCTESKIGTLILYELYYIGQCPLCPFYEMFGRQYNSIDRKCKLIVDCSKEKLC